MSLPQKRLPYQDNLTNSIISDSDYSSTQSVDADDELPLKLSI